MDNFEHTAWHTLVPPCVIENTEVATSQGYWDNLSGTTKLISVQCAHNYSMIWSTMASENQRTEV